jgi:integrase
MHGWGSRGRRFKSGRPDWSEARRGLLRRSRRGVDAPRTRHTFVSLCAHDVNLEDIARLVGHSGTAVSERIYGHEIRPPLTQGAEILDQLFQ